MKLLLLTFSTLSAFAIRGALNIEALYWTPCSVESSTAMYTIKCTDALEGGSKVAQSPSFKPISICRRRLGNAATKCRGLGGWVRFDCITGYFTSRDNGENCEIKCEWKLLTRTVKFNVFFIIKCLIH